MSTTSLYTWHAHTQLTFLVSMNTGKFPLLDPTYRWYILFLSNTKHRNFKSFPAHDEQGMSQASLVSPQPP